MKIQQKKRVVAALSVSALLFGSFGYSIPLVLAADEAKTQPDNKTPPTKGSNDAVPDWLKELDKSGNGANSNATPAPPAASTSPAATSSGEQPATTKPAVPQPQVIDDMDFTKPKQSETKTSTPVTTSLGPIVPPSTPVRPVVVPTTQAKPTITSSTPAKPTKMLVGRLEELGGYGAKLPIGLQLKGLKAQSGKMDNSSGLQGGVVAQQLPGTIKSFPMDWRGVWGGTLTIHDCQLDKASYAFDAQEARNTAEILQRGAQPQATFVFSQEGRKISLEPGKLVFPPRKSRNKQEIQGGLENQGMGALASLFGGANGDLLSSLAVVTPVMLLGEAHNIHGTGGTILNSEVIKNSIRQLKEGVIEQNLIVRTHDKSSNGNSVVKIAETVLRFTKLNQSQLYVQAASVTYRNDGHFLEKVLFYGTITRGASADPYGMPGMTGFPGLGGLPGMGGGGLPGGGTGGLGGFDAINEMMKQLQGQ